MGDAVANCANCGGALTGRFCAACGQDSRQRLTVQEFAGATLGGILNLDSRFWRTLRDMCVPGKLTEEYLAGRRARYMPPVQTYLVVAALFFSILAPGTTAVLTSDDYRTAIARHAAAQGVSVAQRYRAEEHASPVWDAERRDFESRAAHASLLMFVLLPVLAFALHAVHLSSGKLYLENLVLALHLQTFVWAVFAVLLATESLLFWLWWPTLPDVLWYSAVAGLVVYGIASLRRVYRVSWAIATVRFVGVLAAYLVLLGSLGPTVERIWGAG